MYRYFVRKITFGACLERREMMTSALVQAGIVRTRVGSRQDRNRRGSTFSCNSTLSVLMSDSWRGRKNERVLNPFFFFQWHSTLLQLVLRCHFSSFKLFLWNKITCAGSRFSNPLPQSVCFIFPGLTNFLLAHCNSDFPFLKIFYFLLHIEHYFMVFHYHELNR